MNRYIGLDLGQASDYTALSIVERIEQKTGIAEWNGAELVPETVPVFHLRHLERPKLGTSYVDIVARCLALMRRPELRGARLVLDATGVGRAVVDMFHKAGLRPVEIHIHGGEVVRQDGNAYHVPKRDLAGVLQALLQSGRLRIAQALPLAQTLVRELLAFKVKVNIATGHDSYEAWREGDHDDLVLSVGMACWFASQPGPPRGIGLVPLGLF